MDSQSYFISYPFSRDGIGYMGWGLESSSVAGDVLTIKPYLNLANNVQNKLLTPQSAVLTLSIVLQYTV